MKNFKDMTPEEKTKFSESAKSIDFIYKVTDCGKISSATESTIKYALGRDGYERISPAGQCDFIYNRKKYDVKVNGTCIQYNKNEKMIKGSSRVIYATHVSYTQTDIGDGYVKIKIDLINSEFFVVDRDEFLQFVLEGGYAKENKSRGTVNIQTLYDYKNDKYHGTKGHRVEAWCREHEILDDDIISHIYDILEY